MKIIVRVILGALVIMATGCNKSEKAETNDVISTSIVGSWELRKASAAMNPNVITMPAGNGNILKFTATTYESYVNGQLTKSGQYVVVKDLTVEQNICLVFPTGQFTNRLVYDSAGNGAKEFFQVINNKLTIVSGCYVVDAGTTREYQKQ